MVLSTTRSLSLISLMLPYFFFSEQLIIANPGQAVIDKLHAAEFMQLIGEDNIFLTVADAVLTCAPKMEDP